MLGYRARNVASEECSDENYGLCWERNQRVTIASES